jgi:lysine biosynthesis protein LysW
MAQCPECEADVGGTDLEVVGLAPLELDPAPAEEDDWQ